MKCILCDKLSFSIICTKCQILFLKPLIYKRELEKGFYNYSFYIYKDIKELINTKYEFYGDRVFEILAKKSFLKFSNDFDFNYKVTAIAIDDHTGHSFSQSAILLKHMKCDNIDVLFSVLRAKNKVKYAGKSLEFRITNKRNFIYSGPRNTKVILIDDIVTSGQTLKEAKKVLEFHNCEVLFSLTLSDAKIC